MSSFVAHQITNVIIAAFQGINNSTIQLKAVLLLQQAVGGVEPPF